MCGRYTLRLSPAELAEIFAVLREPDFQFGPRYNIAPTVAVPIVRAAKEGGRELALVRWGLIPSWAKDAKIASSLINARSDGVATKPSFRTAFKRRRCIVPADQFYEWKAPPETEEKPRKKPPKQPYAIGLKELGPMGFAGIWETWRDPEGTELQTCSIITTDANDFMAEVHNRMPVILHGEDYDRWLTTPEKDAAGLQELLVPFESDRMQKVAISTLVNSTRNEGPEILEPLVAQTDTPSTARPPTRRESLFPEESSPG